MSSTVPKSALASDLIERLARIMRADEHDTGLNPAQWEALRYIARCNRFSNTPAHLTDYVSATRGTVSQTLKALERKGLIDKIKRGDDRRSVSLFLTPLGEKTLSWDPWQRLDVHEHQLDDAFHDGLVAGLRLLLDQEFSRNRLKSFGSCESCRHFQGNVGAQGSQAEHMCGRFRSAICDDERVLICAAHEMIDHDGETSTLVEKEKRQASS